MQKARFIPGPFASYVSKYSRAARIKSHDSDVTHRIVASSGLSDTTLWPIVAS